jgi:hypothetical protein
MLRLGICCSLAALVLLVGCGGGDTSTRSDPASGQISTEKALETGLDSGAVPSRIGTSSQPAPQLQTEGQWFVLPGRKASSRIARDPSKGMQFQLYAQHQVLGTAAATPLRLSPSASMAIPVADNRALFFANAYPSTDLAVLPGPGGPAVTLQLRSPQSPSKFSWKLAGSPGRLVEDPISETAALNYRFHTPNVSGSIDLLYVQVGPLPHDSSGFPTESTDPSDRPASLATDLSLSEDRITVQVDRPAGLVYPLLIDIDWNNDPIP